MSFHRYLIVKSDEVSRLRQQNGDTYECPNYSDELQALRALMRDFDPLARPSSRDIRLDASELYERLYELRVQIEIPDDEFINFNCDDFTQAQLNARDQQRRDYRQGTALSMVIGNILQLIENTSLEADYRRLEAEYDGI